MDSGERSWPEYVWEAVFLLNNLLAGLLAANNIHLLRKLMPHTWQWAAMQDASVAGELEKAIRGMPYAQWQVVCCYYLFRWF